MGPQGIQGTSGVSGYQIIQQKVIIPTGTYKMIDITTGDKKPLGAGFSFYPYVDVYVRSVVIHETGQPVEPGATVTWGFNGVRYLVNNYSGSDVDFLAMVTCASVN
jgi:hypothetical protein